MKLDGLFYPAGSSRAVSATLIVNAHGVARISGPDHGAALLSHDVSELDISPRIGSTPRQLRFTDGSLFETSDNEAVDQLVSKYKPGRFQGLIHRLESRTRHVILSAVITLVLVAAFMVCAVPLASKHIAMSLPVSVATSVGEGTLQLMDRLVFDDSELPEERKDELRQALDNLAAQVGGDYDYQLEFRSSPEIGPNAFALPDGTLILTDELVALAQHDEQIVAVLVHEIGHVVYRHGIRQALQSTGLSVLLVLVTGDVVSATNIAAAIPGFLLESHYSREMETEADDFALRYMQSSELDPARFAEIMTLLSEWQKEQYEEDDDLPAFLSTHPATEERIARFVDSDD